MGLFHHVFNTQLTFCRLRTAREWYISRRILWRGLNSRPTTEENEFGEEKITLKQPRHIPVMLNEVMNVLQPRERGTIVDMTFGAGGHTREIIQRAPDTKLFVLDRDPVAFEMAKTLSMECRQGQVTPLLGRFSELPHLFRANGVKEESLDAFLFDLGASSMQFDESERGFSLSRDGPLDMRMDGGRTNQPTAADVVNDLDESDLHDIIKKYGEEKLACKIARAIVETRYAFGKITRTQQLADIISSVFSGDHKQDKMMRHSHVATKTFQALRIFVNNELNELNNGLEVAHRYLKPGGICVTISFHSLEDRIVKRHFHGIEMDSKLNMNVRDHHRNSMHIHSKQQVLEMLKQRWQPMSKKVSVPEYMDTVANPRARSAKLRAAIRL